MWANQYWAKTYWAGNYWAPSIKTPSVPSIGGGTLEARRRKRWEKERERLKFSIQKIEDKELQNIGQKIIAFEQPKVIRVAKKLIEYSQDVEKSKILDLDLEIRRLEKALKTQKVIEDQQQQKQRELQDALINLKDILKEDMEIIDIYMEIEQKETMALLTAMRIIL